MVRSGERQARNILLGVGLIAGWGVSRLGFSSGDEEILFLIIIAIVVFLVSAVLGRVVLQHENQIPWLHIVAGAGLFVGAAILSFLVFGRSPVWVKKVLALLIALAVLAALARKNLWGTRRPGDDSSPDAPNRRG